MEQTRIDELYNMWVTEFHDKFELDYLEDYEFKGIALGFFIAKGCNIEESESMYDYCIEKGKF